MSRMILASASPRRKELLKQIGFTFEIRESNKEEITTKKKPQEVVQEFSYQKAKDVLEQIEKENQIKETENQIKETEVQIEEPEKSSEESEKEVLVPTIHKEIEDGNVLVIGADTIVYFDGKVLGKPSSKQDAYDTIKALQGKTHEVYTGVTLAWKKDGKLGTYTFCEKTEVVVYPMERDEIISYVKSGEPMDKAGSYAIQGRFGAFIKEIRGEYNNVVGLPVGRLFQEMKNRNLLS